jgi:hypothetical protein
MTTIDNPSICSVEKEAKLADLLLTLTSGEIKLLEDSLLKLGSDTILETEGERLLDQLVVKLDDGKPKALLDLLSKRVVAKDGDETVVAKDGDGTVVAKEGDETVVAKEGDETVVANDRESRLSLADSKPLQHLISVVEGSNPSLSKLLAQRGEYLCNNSLDSSN